MTRGQKGCFVFAVDPETNLYLKKVATGSVGASEAEIEKYPGLALKKVAADEAETHENAVPIFSPQVAAGSFSDAQWIDETDWAILEEPFEAKQGYFLARVMGESMNRRIPPGSWCLFKKPTAGSREGKVVLVQLQHLQDESQMGEFTVKLYSSQKRIDEDAEWRHERIVLKPDSINPDHEAIILEKNETQSLRVIGEYLATLS